MSFLNEEGFVALIARFAGFLPIALNAPIPVILPCFRLGIFLTFFANDFTALRVRLITGDFLTMFVL